MPTSPPPLLKYDGPFLIINECHHPVSCHFFSLQDAEGDEEEDDDPDYQPPPVSQKMDETSK